MVKPVVARDGGAEGLSFEFDPRVIGSLLKKNTN
jgi:hypothetical protein